MNLDVQMVDGLPTVKSTSPALDVQNLITGPKLGSNASQALFTALLESDEGFRMLMNTAMSQQLRALRNGSEGVLLYDTDKDNNRVLVNIPKMSFSPMTSEADSCCVVAGDLQVCQDGTILKSLCLEKCENELDRMIGTVSHTNRNSIVYAAYKEMLKGAGVAKSALPTLEEFELLSLLA